jgi:6,7-dimethyl-8-ribityllumazine synthase
MAESSAQSVSAAHVKAPPSAGELIPGAKHMRIAIVHTEWNTSIITALLEGAIGELRRNGVHRENIEVFRVRL